MDGADDMAAVDNMLKGRQTVIGPLYDCSIKLMAAGNTVLRDMSLPDFHIRCDRPTGLHVMTRDSVGTIHFGDKDGVETDNDRRVYDHAWRIELKETVLYSP